MARPGTGPSATPGGDIAPAARPAAASRTRRPRPASSPQEERGPGEVGQIGPNGRQPVPAVRFLTVAEVAGSMRVSKMTVYRLVHGGTLPAVRVGRSFRVPEDAVTDYLRDSFVQAG